LIASLDQGEDPTDFEEFLSKKKNGGGGQGGDTPNVRGKKPGVSPGPSPTSTSNPRRNSKGREGGRLEPVIVQRGEDKAKHE